MSRTVNWFRSFNGWALFTVLVSATLALGANRPVSWVLMAIAVTLLFCLTLLLDMASRRPRPFNRLWLPALLWGGVMTWGVVQLLPGLAPAAWAHPVWQALSTTEGRIAADPGHGFHILARLACYAMVFWMAVRSAEDTENALRYMRAFALFSIALAGFGIFAAATGVNPITGGQGDVVTASFVNRNNYATFAGFGLVACLALLLRGAARSQSSRKSALAGFLEEIMKGGWLWILGVTVCLGAVLLTQSRAGMIAAGLGVLIVVTAQRQKGNKAAVGPALIVLALLAAIFLSASTGTINRIVSSGENTRFLVYPAVVDGIEDRPLLGHGIGSFHTAFRPYVPAEAAAGGEWDMAHNSYLENAFELGLPAAILFYLALVLIGWRILRGVLTRQRNRSVVSLALACFVLAAFHASLDFSLQMPALAAFFAWILGLGYAQSFPSAQVKGTPR